MAWWDYALPVVALNEWLYSRAFPDPPKPPPFLNTSIPRADVGSPIPMVYGRCRVRSPVLAWFGNQGTNFSSSNSYGYKLDMLYVLGFPFYGGGATLNKIYAGDFVLNVDAATYVDGNLADSIEDSMVRPGRSIYTSTNGSAVLGDAGGIRGNVEFFDGRPDQRLSDLINDSDPQVLSFVQRHMTWSKWNTESNITHPALVDDAKIPGYRNQILCFLFVWVIGRRQSLTSYSFDVTSLSTGTPVDLGHSMTDDADPAAVILDLLTSPIGKLGMSFDAIDLDSFKAVSAALFAEGHGYSRAHDSKEDGWTIIASILRQIEAVLYVEPTTGLATLKLIRSVDPTGAADVNPDNCDPPAQGWYSVRGWPDLPNLVRVKYTSRVDNFGDGMEVAFDESLQAINGVRGLDVEFKGCATHDLAVALAERELAAVSRPIVRASVMVDRSFYTKRIGDVVTLTWPELGVSKMPMRIARINFGRPGASRIAMDLISDIFGE
jgi:Putative phage tail protein